MSACLIISSLHARFGRSVADGIGFGVGASLTSRLFAPRHETVIVTERVREHDDGKDFRSLKQSRRQLAIESQENEKLRAENDELKKKHADLSERLEKLERKVK